MRAGISTILQTLTPESANVLNHSIAEAGRRNHSQTTPLHVATTLLAAPTGFLRQACIRSHPNSSHPLQCRALELCFSVALERLPSNATSSPAADEPPVSNALMAALKRAQAHQRRGCPEQQQQPLLAIKVELEQLIISILDDPSVSRVMREASFSSPAVKATIEQSLNNNASVGNGNGNGNHIGFLKSPMPINRNLYLNPRFQRNDETSVSSSSTSYNNLYLNPRLQQQKQGNLSLNHSGQTRSDDVTRVMEIMSKLKKNNPILVGDFEPESIKNEILMRVQKGELLTQEVSNNVEVISLEFQNDKSMIPKKIMELVMDNGGGVNRSIIIDLGDLKWLVEQQTNVVESDTVRNMVVEMSNLVTKFGSENRNVRLIGTATCETYYKCQIYHPSIESDWDIQPVPISSRSPFSSRYGSNGIFGSSVECFSPFKNSARMQPCCTKCFYDYEQELANLNEVENSCAEAKSNLPQWFQNAKAQIGETETGSDTKMSQRSRVNGEELLKKWSDICSRIHPNYNQSPTFARMMTGLVPNIPLVTTYKPNGLLDQSQLGQLQEAPGSPIHTELALGPKEVHEDLSVKDFLGCISSEPQAKGKFVNAANAYSFMKLFKGLKKKVWWQPEAASAIATTVTQCGNKGSVWLLFAGPDRVGKKKMVSVLSHQVCGADPITVYLGSKRDENEPDIGSRGKTALDRIVEAVRKDPVSVIVLSDIDEADMVVRGSIKRAMEKGRLTDSYGREISLRNIIFVMTGNWSAPNLLDEMLDEKRLRLGATRSLELKLMVSEKRLKRCADSVNVSTKKPKKTGCGISLDLNLAMDVEEERTDTSDVTIEQGDENPHFAATSVSIPHELVGPSDGTVVFKPVKFGLIRCEIEKTIRNTFSTVVDDKMSIEVDEATLDNISCGLWFGQTGLEDWAENVLVPSFHKLVGCLSSAVHEVVVHLESDRDLDQANHDQHQDPLLSKVSVMVDTSHTSSTN
ncbi:protein SUPPRESSOR OF MAX2 1-like [Rutidosis leptorrhynchoides]|uniref:protein SUPPRESSOR OF MAX2 1-like n=1 Tax=Rutidosis leptorrhynchoides TaxID=125765 RepID=UPI003A993E97